MTSPHKSDESSCWQLDQHTASLSIADLSGKVELLHPDQGISSLVYQGEELTGFLLGITIDASISIEGSEQLSLGPIRDQYVRGSDLVVTYEQTEHARPFSLQICWRAGTTQSQQTGSQNVSAQQVGIDLIVSLQTDLLESHPRLSASSRLKCQEVARMSNASDESNLLESGLTPCAIFRLSDGKTSYLESVAARDSVGQKIEQTSNGHYQTTWPLGGDFLEKGVIRRVRMRGLFVPQAQDVQSATALPATLETEQPPLST